MTPENELEETLINFFDAENNWGCKLYESFLLQDVEWISYGPPSENLWSEERIMSNDDQS